MQHLHEPLLDGPRRSVRSHILGGIGGENWEKACFLAAKSAWWVEHKEENGVLHSIYYLSPSQAKEKPQKWHFRKVLFSCYFPWMAMISTVSCFCVTWFSRFTKLWNWFQKCWVLVGNFIQAWKTQTHFFVLQFYTLIFWLDT